MKKAVFAIILAASLAVNAVLVYKHYEKPRFDKEPVPRFNKEAVKLKFTKEQKEKIREILYKSREGFSEHRMKTFELKMKIIDEIAAPSTEPADISEMVAELNSLESEMNVDFVNLLIRVSEELEFEQRVAFLTRFSKVWFMKHYDRKIRRKRR